MKRKGKAFAFPKIYKRRPRRASFYIIFSVIVPFKTVVCPAILAIAIIPNRASKISSKNNKNPAKQAPNLLPNRFLIIKSNKKEPGETNFLGPFRVIFLGQ